MTWVVSEAVRAVGYEPASRTLRVAFRDGGIYEYFDVDPALFEALLLPHAWRRVGAEVTAHRYRRL